MVVMLRSILHEPTVSAAEAEAAPPPAGEPIKTAVTTRPPAPMSDITDSSRRRLVVGKSRERIAPTLAVSVIESVIGHLDERTRIVSTTTAPWKYICALDIVGANDRRFVGTAWVVGPRTLVTAGHCVHHLVEMGGWAREILATPGQDRELRPFGTRKVARFSALDRWVRDNDNRDFDLAALHLDEDLFGPDEGFQVGALPDDALMGSLVNVSGYPALPGAGQEQWWARNRILAVTPRRIFYDVDTSGGQSGGPAYIFPDGADAPIVVGIHAYGVGGTPDTIRAEVNSAPRIIPEVVEQIQAWIDADPGRAAPGDARPAAARAPADPDALARTVVA